MILTTYVVTSSNGGLIVVFSFEEKKCVIKSKSSAQLMWNKFYVYNTNVQNIFFYEFYSNNVYF